MIKLLALIILFTNSSILYPYTSSINYMEKHSIHIRKSIEDYAWIGSRDYIEYGVLFSIPKIQKYSIDIGLNFRSRKFITSYNVVTMEGIAGTEEIDNSIKRRGVIMNLHSPTVIASFNPVISYKHEIETHVSEISSTEFQTTYYINTVSVNLKRNLADRYYLNMGFSGIKSRSEYSDPIYENPFDEQPRANFSSNDITNTPDIVNSVGTNRYAYTFGVFEIALHYRVIDNLELSGSLGKAVNHDTLSMLSSITMRMYF